MRYVLFGSSPLQHELHESLYTTAQPMYVAVLHTRGTRSKCHTKLGIEQELSKLAKMNVEEKFHASTKIDDRFSLHNATSSKSFKAVIFLHDLSRGTIVIRTK